MARRQKRLPAPKSKLLNLGCGAQFHPAWVNVDVSPRDTCVIQHDLLEPLPFAERSFKAVYHSHVLEHLPHQRAPDFLRECHRVLVDGGVMRVAVPDLETIVRLYLENLEGALAGDQQAAKRYEWMMLELVDQLVREHKGGEMLSYWKREPMPIEEFVIQRMGQQVVEFLRTYRARPRSERAAREARKRRRGQDAMEFRAKGEVHRWMYDRYSLRALLKDAGFADSRVCLADESAIEGFNAFHLDVTPEGKVRKPDSLFMEARKLL